MTSYQQRVRLAWPLRLFFRLIDWLEGPLVLLLVALTGLAHAAGTTVPERYAGLCARMGQPDGCTPHFQSAGSAWVTLIVADAVGEPGTTPSAAHGASAVFETRKGTFGYVFQAPVDSWGTCGAVPACLTVECVEERPVVEGYTGPHETDLLSPTTVLNKAVWQTADASLATHLQELFGMTGLPVITAASHYTIDDGSQDATRPTVVRMRVRFAFAQ